MGVTIIELYGVEKFKALHTGDFIHFNFLKKAHLAYIAQMAQAIPVYQIQIPWDKERLSEVYQAILTHN
ncbi:MAG: hypothetical protein Q9M36_07235 [Sulfurovum sp.]|nr:hypothetical protein [Sulfurovum sp.]